MPSRSTLWVGLLLVGLGISTVAFAWTGLAVETDETYQYTAYEIDYDDDAYGTDEDVFELRSQQRGWVLDGSTVYRTNIDDRIACLPSDDLGCALLVEQYTESREVVSARSSRYEYLHLEDGFYSVDPPRQGGSVTFEQVDGSTVFDDLALEPDDLTRLERRVLDDGRVITTRPLPNANRIVEHEGAYYTLLPTGHRAEDGFCSSSPQDDFCEEARRHRIASGGLSLGVGLLGIVGVAIGVRRLFAAGRRRLSGDEQ